MENKIRSFLQHTFLVDFDDDVDETTDLFDSQVIDSFGFIELVTFLEQEFKLSVSEEDLLSNRLNSLSAITVYVKDKSNAQTTEC